MDQRPIETGITPVERIPDLLGRQIAGVFRERNLPYPRSATTTLQGYTQYCEFYSDNNGNLTTSSVRGYKDAFTYSSGNEKTLLTITDFKGERNIEVRYEKVRQEIAIKYILRIPTNGILEGSLRLIKNNDKWESDIPLSKNPRLEEVYSQIQPLLVLANNGIDQTER